MDNDTLFKILAVVSPFVSGGFTYILTQRSKKSEYLYQNRIPAFKEMLPVLVKIKKYTMGRMALANGAEYSPYFGTEGSALILRTELANIKESNSIFLTKRSNKFISELDSSLGNFCNAETSAWGSPEGYTRDEFIAVMPDYSPLLDIVEKCLIGLYEEVGLSKD
jgi:hypothetical protein